MISSQTWWRWGTKMCWSGSGPSLDWDQTIIGCPWWSSWSQKLGQGLDCPVSGPAKMARDRTRLNFPNTRLSSDKEDDVVPDWLIVMTRSMLSPEPVPAPAQPQTDPRRFIADAPCVTSRHVTHSHHAHPQMCASASWYARPLVVRTVSLPAL